MLLKGIVEKVIDSYSVKVRIPLFDKIATESDAVTTENLHTACISTLPNINPQLKPGDIVIVGFEDSHFENPIILGTLFLPSTSTYTDIIVQTLDVLSYVKLPTQTIIGDISYSDISKLSGLTDNIQHQLNDITLRLQKVEDYIQPVLNNTTLEDLDNSLSSKTVS